VISSLLAAFITSEVVLNGLEDNEDVLFIVTLDAEKAFDQLNHGMMMYYVKNTLQFSIRVRKNGNIVCTC
jgi:retron-type reverse transcriptase